MINNYNSILPDTKEHWLALRSKYITSTEVSALFGISPYMTEYELYHHKKSGHIVTIEENERMKWGNRLENSIAMGVAEDKGWQIKRMPEFKWLESQRIGSSYDYIMEDLSAIVEIKNVDNMAFRDKWQDDGINLEAPPHIELQIQHQMLVAGIAKAYICALVGGNELIVVEREASQAIFKAILDKAHMFWERVETGTEPTPDFQRDAEFIQSLHNKAEPGSVIDADIDIYKYAIEYKQISDQMKALDLKKNELKARLLMFMGTAEKCKGEDFTISAGMTAGSEFTVKREPFRNFRINWRK